MIGKLDQRITFERLTPKDDGIGGQTVTWLPLLSVPRVWANVAAKAGREAMVGDRMTASASYVFTVRYRADVTEKDRIIWGGQAHNIRTVMRQSGRDQYLKIETERGVAS